MKRGILFSLFIFFTLTIILGVVHTVSAEGNPPPVIEVTAEILHCNLPQGWCSSMPQVQITASASGMAIQAIEGRLNGVRFKRDGAVMILDLANDFNKLIYWAVSSSGQESNRHYLAVSMEARNVLDASFHVLPNNSTSSESGRLMSAGVLDPSMELTVDGNTHLPQNKGQFMLADALVSLSSITEWQKLKEPEQKLPKINSKLISYLFTQLVGRKRASLVSSGIMQGDSTIYSLVLEDTPPQLSIEPQTDFSGRLAFSGEVADDLSGLKSLMKRINDGWQSLEWQDSTWRFVWDTEREHISSGEFTLQLLAEDVAGNTQTASLQFQVLNRTWPFFTLWALLLALALALVLNPRRKAWREFTAFVSRMTDLGLVDYFKEEE